MTIIIYPTYCSGNEGKLRLLYALREFLRRYHKEDIILVIHPDYIEILTDYFSKFGIETYFLIIGRRTDNSFDEIQEIKKIADKIKADKIIIFTSEYHTSKWYILAKKFGIDAEVKNVSTNYSILKKSS